MKKLLLPFVILFLISSCSTDNESTDTSTASIIGKWQIVSYEDNATALMGCDVLDQREFKTNSSLTETFFTGNNCETILTNNDWNYSISNGQLFTTEPNGGLNPAKDYIINYNIIQLTDNTLKIELYYIDEGVDGFDAREFPKDERPTETWQRID